MRRYCLAGLLLSFYVVGAIFGDPPAPRHGRPVPVLTLPSERPGNVGYQVGGGTTAPHFGAPRRAEEGRPDWEYQGRLLARRATVGWWHGRR